MKRKKRESDKIKWEFSFEIRETQNSLSWRNKVRTTLNVSSSASLSIVVRYIRQNISNDTREKGMSKRKKYKRTIRRSQQSWPFLWLSLFARGEKAHYHCEIGELFVFPFESNARTQSSLVWNCQDKISLHGHIHCESLGDDLWPVSWLCENSFLSGENANHISIIIK